MGFQVLKHHCRFSGHGGQVERILHEEEDINVIRVGFGSDERAEYRNSRHLPGRGYELVETVQPSSYSATLDRPLAEACKHLRQCCTMHTGWQVSVFVEGW